MLGVVCGGSSEAQNGQTVPDSLFREPVADVIEVGRVRTAWCPPHPPPPQSPHTETESSPQLSSPPPACQAIELSSSESANGTPSWLETSSRCSELFSFQRALPKLFKSPLWRSREQGRVPKKCSRVCLYRFPRVLPVSSKPQSRKDKLLCKSGLSVK